MVMHARKHPRLTDGFYDRREYHEDKNDRFQVRNSNYDRKQPSSDRRPRDNIATGKQQNNSPRYTHKLPSLSRIRVDQERDRYGKTRDQERYTREEYRPSADKRDTSTSNSLTTRTSIGDHTLVDNNEASNNVDAKRQSKERDMRQSEDRRAITTADKKHHSGHTKDPRTEAQKTALRVCGDWSEHVSSSGKKYFYNCKSEVSQWVKPKEWKAADEQARQGSIGNGTTASTSHKKVENIAQNGSRQKVISDSPNRPSGSSKNCDDNNKQKHLEMDSRKRHSSSSQLPNGITSKPHTEHPQTANHNSGDHQQNNHSSSRTSTPSSSMETDSPSTSTRKKKSTDINNSRQHLKDSTSKNEHGSDDDMDISPDTSPKSNPHTKSVAEQALETLKNLQEVLLERSRAVPTIQPVHSSVASGSPRSKASPRSETSKRSRTSPQRSKPLPSPIVIPVTCQSGNERVVDSANITADGNSPSSCSEASGAAPRAVLPSPISDSLTASISLPPSLYNYYDSSLISHISDWPGEQIELRAHLVYKDGLIIGGHHCGQVSTELKRDRSQVRIAEVQSTLIEHRIMFLKQQISELEAQDRSFP